MRALADCHATGSGASICDMKNDSLPCLCVEAGQFSSRGPKEENEDCTGVRVPERDVVATKGVAAVVADGVSAAKGGKVAGEMCVQGFLSDYFCTPETWSVKTSGQRVLNGLNRWLYGQGNTEGLSDEKGYLATHSSLVLCSRTGFIFHVGDTRIYRVRGRQIEQLTRDHRSAVSGAGFLNRAMGLNLNLKVDYREVDLEEGDCFLLCTDGVHDWLGDEEMRREIASGDDLDAVAERIVRMSLEAGGDDNATCVVVRVDALPESSYQDVQRIISDRPFPPLLAPGMKIDGLEVMEVMVESSRSQLYRVKDIASGVGMVMKTPSPNYQDDPGYIERFAAEEWIGKRVQHENLVRVIDHPGKPTFLYYLMESLDGLNLAEWLAQNRGKLQVDQVVDVVRQVVAGVRALHRREVLHQDLKLENIVVDDSGVVRVIDYGSCRIAGMQERLVQPGWRDEQDILGTIDFAAPEYRMPSFEGIGPRADQFSIAMIAYHLLSGGKCPYGEKWIKASRVDDFKRLDYTPVYHHNPMVPIWLDGALKRALGVSAMTRYPGMSEWLYDLSHPNAEYTQSGYLPLIERDPVRFWKLVSAVLAGLVVILLLTR